jgi:hypothetical protein
MPSTYSNPETRHNSSVSANGKRTAIIVVLVVGVLGMLVIAHVLWKRRVNRGVRTGNVQNGGRERRVNDKDVEVGVIREPLPVYRKEMGKGEKRVWSAAGGEAG